MTNKKFFVVVLEWCHCENLQSVSVQIRGNPKVNLRLNLWIATPFFKKTARNDDFLVILIKLSYQTLFVS